MRRINQRRTLIIVSVIALVFFAAIGYAGYTAALKINANYSVTENFEVKITDIQTKSVGGHAINNSAPTFDGTTASFDAKFYLPGDYIEYKVTLSNVGNVDAYLTSVTPTDSTAPAIIFSYSGITKNDPIPANSEKTVIIRVEYDVNVTEQPEVLTSDYELTLNFADSPSEDSGTGSLYRWGTFMLRKGDNINGSEEDGIYLTADPSTLGYNYYLKHDCDNYVIEESYVCFVTDTEYCLKGGDSSYYQSNLAILQANEEWFNSNGGSCSFETSSARCSSSNYDSIYIANNGTSQVRDKDNSLCVVSSDGSSYCSSPCQGVC